MSSEELHIESNDQKCLRKLCLLFMKSQKFESADKGFDRLLHAGNGDVNDFINAGICSHLLNKLDKSELRFSQALSLNSASVVSLCNLSGIFIKNGDIARAFEFSHRAVIIILETESFSDNNSLKIAANDINVSARLLSRSMEAIQLSRQILHKYCTPSYDIQPLRLPPLSFSSDNPIIFVCVKWGSKYDFNYVNRLFSAVRRNTSPSYNIEYVCITDDSTGIDDFVHIVNLSNEQARMYPAWWSKIWLFDIQTSPNANNLIVYIDLDTVICGSVDELISVGLSAENEHLLGILESENMKNEGYRKGLNSSVMIFRAAEFYSLFQSSVTCQDSIPIHDVIFKLDHWIEMNVFESGQYYSLQARCPGLIVEYSSMDDIQGHSIVCFPLQPKPHQVTHLDWVKQHWENIL